MRKITVVFLKKIADLAIVILFMSANTTSNWICYNPKMPEEIKQNYKI